MNRQKDMYDAVLDDDDPDESFVAQLEVLESTTNTEFSISFHDDMLFLERASQLLTCEKEDMELRRRLESVLPPAALPHNEKVDPTLLVLQKTYGLVVQDGAASLSALIAGVLNRTLETKFSINVSDDETEDEAESRTKDNGFYLLQVHHLRARRKVHPGTHQASNLRSLELSRD
ncbi:hypothetical protein BGZ83_009069 [Gryganskiella cystojenkinii]|nr:hypothetical protein BGZ83_009069 [Gryganskiella cystojenkinii]